MRTIFLVAIISLFIFLLFGCQGGEIRRNQLRFQRLIELEVHIVDSLGEAWWARKDLLQALAQLDSVLLVEVPEQKSVDYRRMDLINYAHHLHWFDNQFNSYGLWMYPWQYGDRRSLIAGLILSSEGWRVPHEFLGIPRVTNAQHKEYLDRKAHV